jgi:hypothetical protein
VIRGEHGIAAEHFISKNGGSLSSHYKQRKWLFNKGIDAILNIHLNAPSPDTKITYLRKEFEVEEPKKSPIEKIGFFAALFDPKKSKLMLETRKRSAIMLLRVKNGNLIKRFSRLNKTV